MQVLEFDPKDRAHRQDVLAAFGQAVKAVVRQDTGRRFNHEMLVLMLLELAKNTFDHSTGHGQLEIALPTETTALAVVYRDFGEAFDWCGAAMAGVTSKAGNGVNCGLGLALVERCAESSGLTLNVKRVAGCTEIRITRPHVD